MNMKKTSICFLLILLSIHFTNNIRAEGPVSSFYPPLKQPTIYFEINVSKSNTDSLTIFYRRTFKDSIDADFLELTSPIINGKASFEIAAQHPVSIYTRLIFPNNNNWIAEPGDSTLATIQHKKVQFSGRGAEKYELCAQLDSAELALPKPANTNMFRTENVEDFLATHQYLQSRLKTGLEVLDKNKSRLSTFVYNTLRVGLIQRAQSNKLDKFSGLISLSNKKQLSKQELCVIFDSCFNSPEWQWALSQSEYLTGWYAYIRAIVGREHSYQYDSDSMSNASKRRVLYYNRGINIYTGRSREIFLSNLLTNEGIGEVGFTPEIQYLLKRYYSEPGYPGFKLFVKNFEAKAKKIRSGSKAPTFSLTDENDQIVTNEAYKDKLVLLDFWFTGCAGCVQMAPILAKVEKEFQSDTNVVFLNISIDESKAKWQKSLREKKYTSASGSSLYTGGQGANHAIIDNYNIRSYPNLFFINEHGKIEINPLPDPRDDSGKHLKALIEKRLLRMQDGPYIVYQPNMTSIYNISGNHVKREDKLSLADNAITVSLNKTSLSFKLKDSLVPEPSIFEAPASTFVLSDIEGNLEALTKLLQANNIVDENLSWTFNNNHLVLIGDLFDRGDQVTECLWLIYALEEQAKKQGGYVHFILGNHEIMNITGDLRYMNPKYEKNIGRMNIPYSTLLGRTSELGRWLRTKNLMEKIGDHLFVHGGISNEVNNLSLSIEQINDLARRSYDYPSNPDATTAILFDTRSSPLWYRLYYLETDKKVDARGDVKYKATSKQVDRTLRKFNVAKIITGHTIVADSISSHFDGKIINVDTKHAAGQSEGLLIIDNKYLRVNQTGQNTSLF